MEGYEHCYSHRPDLAGERRSNASKGGRSGGRGRPQTEIADLKQQIRGVIQDVRCGDLPQGQGAVIIQAFNLLARVHEQERREESGRNITPEDLSRQMQMVVEIVGRHIPDRERLRAFLEDIDALLDEDSG